MAFAINCPECREPPDVTCRCMRGDSYCKNGHFWTHCLAHGEARVVLAIDDEITHQRGLDTCICDLQNPKTVLILDPEHTGEHSLEHSLEIEPMTAKDWENVEDPYHDSEKRF